jgi:plastocyanin
MTAADKFGIAFSIGFTVALIALSMALASPKSTTDMPTPAPMPAPPVEETPAMEEEATEEMVVEEEEPVMEEEVMEEEVMEEETMTEEPVMEEEVEAAPMSAEVSIPGGSATPGCEENNECFIPYEVTIGVGGTVTWTNDDTAAHTVTSGTVTDGPDGVFDSSLFMAGRSFEFTFEESGEYDYFCVVHPWMAGKVIVE